MNQRLRLILIIEHLGFVCDLELGIWDFRATRLGISATAAFGISETEQ
jgi:hypothetical protein